MSLSSLEKEKAVLRYKKKPPKKGGSQITCYYDLGVTSVKIVYSFAASTVDFVAVKLFEAIVSSCN